MEQSNQELQAEEIEVLLSIYDGDSNFKQLSGTVFQYKLGDEGDKCTVLIEIQWPSEYPEGLPKFSLSAFYNNHLSAQAKNAMLVRLEEEAEKNVGSQQTFTLIEWAKENYEEILGPLTAQDTPVVKLEDLSIQDREPDEARTKAAKKEQLTKNQKRKEWDRLDAKGEKPRGYDWVDIVKHLSQTGGRPIDASTPQGQAQPTNTYLSNDYLPN